MSSASRQDLLQFLQVPRFAQEVAEHFGTSEKIARLRLREAIKTGQVLASKTSDYRTSSSSNGVTRKATATLYVSRKSRMLFDDQKKLSLRAMSDSTLQFKRNAFSARSASLYDHLVVKDLVSKKFSGFSRATSKETANSAGTKITYKLNGVSASESAHFSPKTQSSSRGMPDRVLGSKQMSQKSANSLSHLERIHLLRALSDKPSAFLDLHKRFGLSKQMVKGLIKNGLIAENWSSNGVGVRYRLTKKGKSHLRKLEEAARCGSNLANKAFVRLRMKI